MGEWKAPLSLRVRQALRSQMQELAAREMRSLGNLAELLLEWSVAQLTAAGSTNRLLRHKIQKKNEPERPERKD